MKSNEINAFLIGLLGGMIGAMSMTAYISHKNESAIYDKVNSAQALEVNNPIEARPWDYCRNENPKSTPKGDSFYDACLQRLYAENPGLNRGRYFSNLRVPDIDGDGKVSSKH